MVNVSVRRAIVVGLALATWVGVAAIATGERPSDRTWFGTEGLDVVFYAVLALLAVAGLVLLVVLRPWNSEWRRPERKSRNSLWVFFAIAFVIMLWRPQILDGLAEQLEEDPGAEVMMEPLETAPGPAETPVAQATDVLMVLALAGVIAAAGLWIAHRSIVGPPPVSEESADRDEALVAALTAATTQLLATRNDPRSAVIAAYATVESEMADRGVSRAVAETAIEHMERAVQNLAMDAEAIVDLGRLYEVARFYDLPVRVADQHAAGRSLQRVRDDLAQAATAESVAQ